MTNSLPTPSFLVDESALAAQVDSFQEAMATYWPTGIVSYSVKTNALPWIVSWMARQSVWAEVVSDHEYELALALGHRPERIIFNGPAKSREVMLEALSAGALVNLDSHREVRWVAEYARAHPAHDVAVGVRVNWDVDGDCPGATASGADGLRFGFHVETDLWNVIDTLSGAGVRIAGLHLHVTSLKREISVYKSAARTVRRILLERSLMLDYIDIGGGFFGGADPRFPTPHQYLRAIREELTDPNSPVDPSRTRLIIEPGSALVAVALEFHTSVLDTKRVPGGRIVVTDGSRTNIDPFFRKTSYRFRIESAGPPSAEHQIICGFTCLDNDRLMALDAAPYLSEGDRIIYEAVGSYTMCFTPLFINLFPATYVRREDGRILVAREPWSLPQYLAKDDWTAT
ncbi:hypothetical protein [Ancrocorticia populi]|uniref:Orn/DAP/Arg decarboxylase 2 N-terminal domain-containing protein n=1 Tax=Ancrocorticia populi TaxID=2175228 RepID=A0A2V1K851_9ACTO|nr:hypothetical protein [Ancrocorticia populi]PWF26912.1 hypothetical protein DD236_00395 [Ancrocorticia populi]